MLDPMPNPTPNPTPRSMPNSMIDPEAFGGATLRRIEWLTVAVGAAGSAWGVWRWGWRGGAGLALGAMLSWINFRWLKSSVQAFGKPAMPLPAPLAGPVAGPVAWTVDDSKTSQPVVPSVRVPVRAYLKFFGRFALLLAAVYVILTRSWLPAVPVITGLFAAAAATVLGLVYEMAFGSVRPR